MKRYFEHVYFSFKKKYRFFTIRLLLIYSRCLAHRYRRQVIRVKGVKVADRKTRKKIKSYAKRRFGSSAFWPYLALYTEVRGQFIEGWLPFDYYRYLLLPKANPGIHRELSNVKTFDHRLFGDFAITPLVIFISGSFYGADMKKIDKEKVKAILSKYDGKIVIKEESGMGGKQIQIMQSPEFEAEMLRPHLNYVVQPYIKQHKAISDLYPDSVNTLKVTTFLGPDGSVKVKHVILRFGLDGSKVDNLSIGGLFIYFSPTGEPSEEAYDGVLGLSHGKRHKNTAYAYSDVKIPMFTEILEKCKAAHMKYPYVRIVGWDVCITESGEAKLIEWNAFSPSLWRFEAVFGPFWPDQSEIDDLNKFSKNVAYY